MFTLFHLNVFYLIKQTKMHPWLPLWLSGYSARLVFNFFVLCHFHIQIWCYVWYADSVRILQKAIFKTNVYQLNTFLLLSIQAWKYYTIFTYLSNLTSQCLLGFDHIQTRYLICGKLTKRYSVSTCKYSYFSGLLLCCHRCETTVLSFGWYSANCHFVYSSSASLL